MKAGDVRDLYPYIHTDLICTLSAVVMPFMLQAEHKTTRHHINTVFTQVLGTFLCFYEVTSHRH